MTEFFTLFGSDVEWAYEVGMTTAGSNGWQLWETKEAVTKYHPVVADGSEVPVEVLRVPVFTPEQSAKAKAALAAAGFAEFGS